MPSRLRQIVLVVDTLEPTLSTFRELFQAGPGDVDPGMSEFGLGHEVLRVGRDTYVEICAPLDPVGDTTANRFLRRGGEGGYMAVVQVPDAETLRARLAERGLKIPLAQTHQGNELTQLHPREFGTLLEADEIRSGADWHYPALETESPSTGAEVTYGIVALDVGVAEPTAMAARWADVFGLALDPAGTAVSFPDGGDVNFVESEGPRDGVVAVAVEATRRSDAGTEHRLGGVDVRFV